MPQIEFPQEPYVLGIDLGSASLGWCLVSKKPADNNPRIIRAGVRCFQAGVEGDIESGRDSSRAASRRMKRQPRRQSWRRKRRKLKLFNLLIRHGLLPNSNAKGPVARHLTLQGLDARLRTEFLENGNPIDAHLLPYKLRSAAVDREISMHAFGRALLHLNQRRGFNSGLKRATRDDEDQGQVKKGISDLAKELNGRTLGQFFSSINPEDRRIRGRWTARQMYVDEFERMWAEQAKHHSQLTREIKQRVFDVIFFQRPLKSQKGLVGACTLEPNRRRCRLAMPIAQRFRLLQKVNDLLVSVEGSTFRKLSANERQDLLRHLEVKATCTFAGLRKLLKFPKGTRFNFEEGGEKGLVGNRTNAAFLDVFGQRWMDFSDAERDKIVLEVLSYRNLDKLAERGRSAWSLDREASVRLAEMTIDDGHASLSRRALERLVEAMEQGKSYTEARTELYPTIVGTALDALPPVQLAMPQITNPAVIRAMTELRKVVNAIIREYGKPMAVHVELARDLRRSRKERERITKSNRDRERQRKIAIERLLKEIPGCQPNSSLVEKVLLAEECQWVCPYTVLTAVRKCSAGRPDIAALV